MPDPQSTFSQVSDKGFAFAENFAKACLALRKAVDAGEGLTLDAAAAEALMNGLKALNGGYKRRLNA